MNPRYQKYTIERVLAIFEKEGYSVLSTKYVNNKSKLDVMCPLGHICKASIKGFHRDAYRCSKCKNCKKYTLEEVRQIFKDREYTLISTEYKNNGSKLSTICPNGHQYEVKLMSFNKGDGCKRCRGTQPISLDAVHQLLQKEGYGLVSEIWKNGNEFVILRCPIGHEYRTKITLFKNQGLRCKICNINIEEENIRSIFETFTGKKFISIRPNWLKNPKTRCNLELDGYCEELKIAFEYDGVWHYKPIAGYGILKRQKDRDVLKDSLCENLGIRLIRIPYFMEDKIDFIKNQLGNENS